MKTKEKTLTFLVIALVTTLIYLVLQPRIGVRDVDSYAYIVGSYSIKSGNGYKTLAGEPVSWWPPGYSLLLSLFPNALLAALIINGLCFGISVGLLYLNAIRSHYTRIIALCLSVALGFNFFRRFATNAAPDILTYAGFLLGLYWFRKGKRLLAYSIWNLLIPFKLIAVVFSPAAYASVLLTDSTHRLNKSEGLVVFGGWATCLGVTSFFNYVNAGIVAQETNKFSLLAPFTGLVHIAMSIPRNFLASWYGSLRSPVPFFAFSIVLIVSLLCLFSLKLHSRALRLNAVLLIVLSLLILTFKSIGPDTRLFGYGLVVALLAYHPRSDSIRRWVLYACLVFGLTIYNVAVANSMGVNDPRYEWLANNVAKAGVPYNVPTNSFHMLDIHQKIATVFARIDDERVGDHYLLVTLPRFDAITTTVEDTPTPKGWCSIWSTEGATLLKRCQ